jgi:hypothetical protein
MKKLILLLVVIFALGSLANAQKYYSKPSTFTVAGDTTYLPAAAGYDLKNIESGVFSYTFTHTDVADSLAAVAIQYSNDQVTWTYYTGNAALSATSTDGQDRIYISTPLIDRYVRVILRAASGDTTTVSGNVLMLKED